MRYMYIHMFIQNDASSSAFAIMCAMFSCEAPDVFYGIVTNIRDIRNFALILIIFHRLNICRKTVAETRSLLQKTITIYQNCLNDPTKFFDIAIPTMDGLWYIDITANRDALMSFIYKIHGLECKLSDFSPGFYIYFIVSRETR